MNAIRKLARPVALAISVLTLTSAVILLLIDWGVAVSNSEELANRLSVAEDAAREDPSAAPALQQEVERQTANSLHRASRQRMAGATGLIAAGACIVLLKVKKTAQPVLPRYVTEAVTCQEKCEAPKDRKEPETRRIAKDVVVRVDLSPVDDLVKQTGREQRDLIPLLHRINQHYNYVPPTALERVADLTGIAQAEISTVASFYTQFRPRPRGKHLVQVCQGTACHVAGADRILDELRRELRIPPGGDTDSDAVATVEAVGCLGCCTLAPVVDVDKCIEGHVTVDSLTQLVDWTANRNGRTTSVVRTVIDDRPDSAARPLEIRIGLGSCCVAGGSQKVMDCLEQEIAARRINAKIKPVGCVGICHLTPLVEVVAPGAEPIVATRATAADVRQIIRALPGTVSWPQRCRNWLNDVGQRKKVSGNGCVSKCQISPINDQRVRRFVDPQIRIVTEHSGEMDPSSLEQYRAREGFVALEKCLRQQQPESIIQAIESSGLRGRGGGGYPTGSKWRKVRDGEGEKFLVCNGDEGDPGAFMDRMVMESYPFRVLEGMSIAAYAVGVQRAFIYVRHEYPLAVKRLRHAINKMTCEGLLGDRVMQTDFSFHVDVVEGAGAFVCGEETALLQSIMGHRGTPQFRPPYPVERGLFDRPTLVNNVETFANVPWIIRNGADQFAMLGTEKSKGTKVFSLSGKVRRAGLIEIPLGLTIREVVEKIGGGVEDGKRFKAVQIGGPSGGCIPAELGDTPIDYENLQRVGAILGSGGLVVLNDDDCMVDMARYFLEFTQRESCGHCTFCRVGTRKLLDILERLCAGKAKPRDLDEIESLSKSVTQGSLCGLGKTAPNPVVSTLKYFRDEYEAHLKGQCPAGRCKGLIRYEVTRDCVGCTLCAQHCPVGAIPLSPYSQHVIDSNLCTRCDVCRTVCPEQAITVI